MAAVGAGAGAAAGVAGAKKPSVLVLGAYPYHLWISDAFQKVLLTDAKHKAELGPGVTKAQYAAVHAFDAYDSTGLIEFWAAQLHATYQFRAVVALAECDLLRAARIRERLGIKGTSVKQTLCHRDKLLMKQKLAERKIAVPLSARVDGPLDVINFVAKNGYPAVVKPVKGFGSVGVTVLRSEQDLVALIGGGGLAAAVTGATGGAGAASNALDAPLDLEIEKYVDGRMYHVDGLVLNGELKVVWPSRYVNSVANFQRNSFIAGVSLTPANPLTARIQAFAKQCLEAVTDAPPTYPFHLELWHTKSDELVFCEVAGRTGGGGIPEQMLELFTVMLNKTFAQSQAGDKVTGPVEENWTKRNPARAGSVGWLYVYPKVGTRVQSVPRKCDLPGVIAMDVFAAAGREYVTRAHCADAIAGFLLHGKSEDEVEQRIVAVDAWFNALPDVYQPIGAADAKSAPASAGATAPAAAAAGAGGAEDRELTYADTLRLTSSALLSSYLSLIRSDPIFGALAVVITQADVTPFEGLVASAEWEQFYRSLWDVSGVPAVNAQESRFMSLLEAVEGGAPYRKSYTAATAAPIQQLLRLALSAQRKLLRATIAACDQEMAPQRSAAEFILSSFDVFGPEPAPGAPAPDPYALLTNIDRLQT